MEPQRPSPWRHVLRVGAHCRTCSRRSPQSLFRSRLAPCEGSSSPSSRRRTNSDPLPRHCSLFLQAGPSRGNRPCSLCSVPCTSSKYHCRVIMGRNSMVNRHSRHRSSRHLYSRRPSHCPNRRDSCQHPCRGLLSTASLQAVVATTACLQRPLVTFFPNTSRLHHLLQNFSALRRCPNSQWKMETGDLFCRTLRLLGGKPPRCPLARTNTLLSR